MEHLFGTDGIRAAVGTHPLTSSNLYQLGRALGKWVIATQKQPTIALAHDTRFSCAWISAALKSGLLEYPVSILNCHVMPTPVMPSILKEYNQHVGIMITASHNNATDNGIKIFSRAETKISHEDQKQIHAFFENNTDTPDFQNLGTEISLSEWLPLYLSLLERFFRPNFLQTTRIALDCANGSWSTTAQKIFSHFGAQVTTIGSSPNGHNINTQCGSLSPQELQKALNKQGAHIGFAFDGDGDRVIAINKEGEVKNGDDILAFLLQHPRYRQNTTVVGTVMSNEGLVRFIEQGGRTFVRTPVGDSHVVAQLKERNLSLGGEPSGHTILKDFSETADGLFTALRLAETALQTKDWNITTFTKFPQIMINVPVTQKRDLSQSPFCSLIEKSQKQLSTGRLLVRYSGTEPLLRVMVEDADETKARQVGTELSQTLAANLTEEQI